MDNTSTTARALTTLETLQDSPGISAERLALRLGVTERAVRRYVRLLRDAGIPVESMTGRYGGYRLGRGTRLPPVMFTAAEALGLVMTTVENRPDATDSTDPVNNAIAKIARLLPASVAESVAALRQVTTSDPRADFPQPDPETAALLVRAADAHQRVRITYRLREERVLEVDPWAVAIWRGRWYLLGWSHAADARRVYRVDRVTTATVLPTPFTPLADLDPIAAIEDHMSTGWHYSVEVAIEAPLESVARCLPRNIGRLTSTGPDRTTLTGTTNEPHWYARHLTALQWPYRIIGPPELRSAARDLATLLAQAANPD
jgi:predicted DNA-binding transcriptional regulator YafY